MTPKFSPKIVAWLGNGTRQAAHKSQNLGLWLQARLRREFVNPTKYGQPWRLHIKERCQAILDRASAIDEFKAKTRPVDKDTTALAAMLDVDPADSVVQVVMAFITKMLPATKYKHKTDANRMLDTLGIPRWVERKTLPRQLHATKFQSVKRYVNPCQRG